VTFGMPTVTCARACRAVGPTVGLHVDAAPHPVRAVLVVAHQIPTFPAAGSDMIDATLEFDANSSSHVRRDFRTKVQRQDVTRCPFTPPMAWYVTPMKESRERYHLGQPLRRR
jgi:hypothetical protein